jgi:hypothetical protein
VPEIVGIALDPRGLLAFGARFGARVELWSRRLNEHKWPRQRGNAPGPGTEERSLDAQPIFSHACFERAVGRVDRVLLLGVARARSKCYAEERRQAWKREQRPSSSEENCSRTEPLGYAPSIGRAGLRRFEPVFDEVVFAAFDGTERHRRAKRKGVWLVEIAAHLGFIRSGWTTRLLRLAIGLVARGRSTDLRSPSRP